MFLMPWACSYCREMNVADEYKCWKCGHPDFGIKEIIDRHHARERATAASTASVTQNDNASLKADITSLRQELAEQIAKNRQIPINPNASDEALLERGQQYQEQQDWYAAEHYFDYILSRSRCAPAYIGKLCAKLKIRKESDLGQHESPLDNEQDYINALRFADSAYRRKIEHYNRLITDRPKRLAYDSAFQILKQAEQMEAKMRDGYSVEELGMLVEKYEKAGKAFLPLGEYDNALQLRVHCQREAWEYKKLYTPMKQDADNQAAQAAIIQTYTESNAKVNQYIRNEPAMLVNYTIATLEELESGYTQLATAFESLNGYADSEQWLHFCAGKAGEYKNRAAHLNSENAKKIAAERKREDTIDIAYTIIGIVLLVAATGIYLGFLLGTNTIRDAWLHFSPGAIVRSYWNFRGQPMGVIGYPGILRGLILPLGGYAVSLAVISAVLRREILFALSKIILGGVYILQVIMTWRWVDAFLESWRLLSPIISLFVYFIILLPGIILMVSLSRYAK